MSDTLSEHRGYLVDVRRLQRYAGAISQVIRLGDSVVDLGCGFGVLGLLCLKAGAGKVWGIDGTDAIEVAQESMVRAGFSENYHCLQEQTFRAELENRVDVIICDHVGYFGIDYGIIELMHDARKRFLKPGGRMIPERLNLFLAGVRSAACRGRLDAWNSSDVPSEYNWLRSYAVNTKHSVTLSPPEIATDPVMVGVVELGEAAADSLAFKAVLVADETGLIDGITGWFDCELGGGVRMTNSPLERNRIDRPQIFLGFDQPMAVKAGDVLEVSVRVGHTNSLIAWTVRDPSSGKLQKYTNWASMPVTVSDRLRSSDSARSINARGQALSIVLDYLDKGLTADQIEQAVLKDHPNLLPSEREISRFVKDELARYST